MRRELIKMNKEDEAKKIVRDGLEYLGGRSWRCVECSAPVQADCECCEPPRCGCLRLVTTSVVGGSAAA
jgi:hypothetical protein